MVKVAGAIVLMSGEGCDRTEEAEGCYLGFLCE